MPVVFSANGKNIQLKEVADVHMDHEEDKHITRLNGHRSVFITAAQKPGNNISQTRERYMPVLDEFAKTLPANIVLVQNFDQAHNVNRRLSTLG
jgi:multidrug efflux pump subunit AcrB